MGITIKDLAKIANVSHTTISRALNDSPFINEATKLKIKELAKQHGYVPNYTAKSLVLNRSYNIGVFFSTINHGTSQGFFYETIKGVNSVIKDSFNLVIKSIDGYTDFTSINSKSFDGIILMSQSDSDDDFIDYLLKKNIPLVVLNREVADTSVINILSADKIGANTAVNYLIENGHKKIALIEGKEGFKSTIERRHGFFNALKNNNLTMINEYIVKGAYTIESGYKAMKKLLTLKELPTAVFSSNDEMAVGAIKAIIEYGLNVPKDISVIGFDDSEFCGYITPTLTTVNRDISEVSKEGAQRLLALIEGNQPVEEKIFINTELIIRESVAKLV